MELGSRLALEAIVLGLRRSGVIHNHALTVIIDELRLAARQARAELHDQAADQIEILAQHLHLETGVPSGRDGAQGRITALKQRAG